MEEGKIFEGEGAEAGQGPPEEPLLEEAPREEVVRSLEEEISRQKDKYLRLYSDFETFKRHWQKEKEESLKYANEDIMKDILPSLDNLETALKHAKEGADGLREGVEMTLRELLRVLDKFGLKQVPALGLPFNPEYHHAISQVEREDVEDNTVVEEFRRGYSYNGKVIRATLVAVSRRPKKEESADEVKIKRG